jgi:hypothetical protein
MRRNNNIKKMMKSHLRGRRKGDHILLLKEKVFSYLCRINHIILANNQEAETAEMLSISWPHPV